MADLASRLSSALEMRGMKQAELSRLTGINKSSICMYLIGDYIPKRDKLMKMAGVLGVSPDWLSGADVSPEGSEEGSAEPAPTHENPIVSIFNGLNMKGKDELLRYGRYLSANPSYALIPGTSELRYIRHYRIPAAAGYASPIEGEDYEEIVRPDDAPEDADFAITIQGDSMEPFIPDGTRVYVRRGANLSQFDVGIFFVDGDVYCKQYCVDSEGNLSLLSANPKRKDANKYILRSSGSHVVCFGKVLLPIKLPCPKYE
ncbi:MAG: helix-turn-helix domain-containing protein [Oscillospiraceae bacterium]|nr:helix-turn-helix domain-containing protein [Oscillospiraceae bacterium]